MGNSSRVHDHASPQQTGAPGRPLPYLDDVDAAAGTEGLSCEDAVNRPAWEGVRRLSRVLLADFRALGVAVPELSLDLFGGLDVVSASEREPADLTTLVAPPLPGARRADLY